MSDRHWAYAPTSLLRHGLACGPTSPSVRPRGTPAWPETTQSSGPDASFAVLRHNMPLVLIMATGSIMGTVLGGLLLGVVPSTVFIPILAALLLISAVKVWRH